MQGEAASISREISGEGYDFNTIVDLFGIPLADIDSLKTWLEQNREKTQESIDRLFHSREINEYEFPMAMDIPTIRKQSEEFAYTHIKKYHNILGKFLQNLTKAGEIFREVNVVPTTEDRSYFNDITNNLALSISNICFSKEDGTLSIREKELIRLFGHEGMGHALNFMFTKSAGLPYFLTRSSLLNKPTTESVAQFYEKVLMEDLRRSPETQKLLGIESRFNEIYREAKDTEQIEEYSKKIAQYCIAVFGKGDPRENNDPGILKGKTEEIYRVAINKGEMLSFLHKNIYPGFDHEGKLSPKLVRELIYCAEPVKRALEELSKRGINYDKNGRETIDSIFLRGLWTPTGFLDNARLRAEKK